MRECYGGKQRKLPRAASAPNMRIMIPSEDIGEYEDSSKRIRSAQVKKKGGLFPLDEEGEYGAPPTAIPKPLPGYQRRERKAKVYASYAISSDCDLHASKLEKNEKDRGETPPRTLPRSRKTSLSSRASASPSRSRTMSPSPNRFQQDPTPWRNGQPSSSNDTGYSAIKTIAKAVKSQNGFSSSKLKSSSYNKISRDMRESSFEEKEEFEYQNKNRESCGEAKVERREGCTSKISLNSMREPVFDSDAMGILGLSNMMLNSWQSKQASFISLNFSRKKSMSSHVM